VRCGHRASASGRSVNRSLEREHDAVIHIIYRARRPGTRAGGGLDALAAQHRESVDTAAARNEIQRVRPGGPAFSGTDARSTLLEFANPGRRRRHFADACAC
jgi:hypothetical protein